MSQISRYESIKNLLIDLKSKFSKQICAGIEKRKEFW